MGFYKGVQTPPIYFSVYDSSGNPVLDPTVSVTLSRDGGAFAPATNTPQVITGTNRFTLVLTAAEMNADAIEFESTAVGGIVDPLTLYPEGDYTSTRAAKLDNADTLTSSRLAPTVAGRTLNVGATGLAAADAVAISGDADAADALESQFDGTGLTGGTYPARQSDIETLVTSSRYTPVGYTLNVGTLQSGSLASVLTHDDVHLLLGETASGLDVEFEFTTEQEEFPRNVTVYGRYQGSNQHHVDAQAYNYLTSAWEDLVGSTGPMQHETTDGLHSFSLGPAHVRDSDGQMRIRLLHDAGATSPNATHRLYLDKIEIEKTRSEPPLTAEEVTAAVWDAAAASHQTAGSLGAAVQSLAVDAAAIATAVWDKVLGSSSAGALLQYLRTKIDRLSNRI